MGSATNAGAYTLMMVGNLHPWRVVLKDTRRSECLTERLVSLLASVFFVLHALLLILVLQSATERCNLWSLFLFLFLTTGLGYRWQRLASQVGLEANWAWTTFSWPVSVLSKQRHPLEGLFRRAGCCRMLLSPLQQSSDQYPELPTWRVLAATWYLVFLLLHHCC